MKKKNIKFAGIVLILLFALNTFGVIFNNGGIPANNHKKSGEIPEIDTFNDEDDDFFDENPINEESPKTASAIELEQDYDFSFNTTIEETWNTSYSFTDYNTTKYGVWINPPEPKGYDVSFQFNVTNMRNSTGDLVNKAWFTGGLAFQFLNLSKVPFVANQFAISDGPGLGNLSSKGSVHTNETFGPLFQLASNPLNSSTYDAVLYFNASKTQNITTEFIPDTENTASDSITWDLNFQPLITVEGNYSANLNIENYSDFTLKSVSGKLGGYWHPADYTETATGIKLNDYFDEFSIKLTTPNYISIVYNDNLTFFNYFTGKGDPDDYELRLYVTCQAAGNLTIYFKNSTNEVNRISQMVVRDEIVFYNYIMNQTYPGGLGSLEISLKNESDKINFGMKTAEIMFFKNTLIGGHTSNTTAFTDFFILAAYFDTDKLVMLSHLNDTGQIGPLTEDELFNQSMIINATVTYGLEGLAGELDYGFIPGINLDLYNTVVDLKEFQIVPGEYNLTFIGSKPGYATFEFADNLVISKKNVTVIVGFTPSDKRIEVEENFAISVTFMVYVSYPPWGETFLRVPVNLSWEIIKDGKLDDYHMIPGIVQAYVIQRTMENDSLPGEYVLNFTIVSDYYQGNISINVTVIKKPLTFSLVYEEDDLIEDEEFGIQWELKGGNTKNRENMSVEIYIDGVFEAVIGMETLYKGLARFELEKGDYVITYLLISPFYTAEITETLEIEEEEEPEPTWLEENWMWMLIGIIAIIAMAALAVFLLISRSKLKAKRELDSELVALKTKATAQEQKLSLIESQIAEIASIYWIIIVHSEQGTTMVEIANFRFEEVLGEKYKDLIGRGVLRDSALIGGFLTAIRNFSRETSGTSMEYQPVFNSQTDYSTIVDNNEIHRRILEGTHHFMAFVSSRGTMEISDILAAVNSIFQDNYGDIVKRFSGAISPFKSYNSEVISYLHNQIRELQNKFSEEQMLLEHFNRHLREVQDKIGIKPKKSVGLDYK